MKNLAGYTLLEKICSTSESIAIYRGMRLYDKQMVMIKLIELEHPSVKENALIQHEYQLLKRFHHHNIIQPYELVQPEPTTTTLILENCVGQTLEKFFAGKPLDLSTFFKIALQIIDVIEFLHNRHIIHKDIKPANFIINPKSLTLKLIDLSLASQILEETQEYVNPDKLEGSSPYLSPEQTGRMNSPVDYRTDFYSLGITFFELLTGKLPFHANTAAEWVQCHIAQKPPLITEVNSNIPVMLEKIITKLLAKNVLERYASSAGLIADLAECNYQWEQKKEIAIFKLGQHDAYNHLQVSRKLYGREKEVAELLTAFRQINQGQAEVVLVSGYSGVGKTSLINEVRKPIAYQGGRFISGKFDQLQRIVPYSAIITAFKGMVAQILTEPEEVLNKTRAALHETLGDIAQVIIEMIPELESIMGKQPPIPTLSPNDAQNRFDFALQKFVSVFSKAEHPLVIFLDDLQWADNASLHLLETLLLNHLIYNVLLIGAYRSNEVNGSHPLAITLDKLQETSVKITRLELEPLTLNDTQLLLTDTFNCAIAKVTDLASCINDKTQGNPFFINEFLKNLYQKNLIRFSYDKSQWQWDTSTIQQENVTVNVIDLLTTKIYALPEETQEILKLASCIGYKFSLQTLITISEKTPITVAQLLINAIQLNLIIPLEKAYFTITLAETGIPLMEENFNDLQYCFIHDRIQQACYELMPLSIRQQTHLRIARLLLGKNELDEKDECLFKITDQFNHSLCLITDSIEKKVVAKYNLWAGKKAKASTAYQAAISYFEAGITLLNPFNWRVEYELLFPLQRELAACKYLIGDFDQAQKYFDALQIQAKNILDKVSVYKLNIEMLSYLNKHTEAINIGLNALNLLGVNIPAKPNMIDLLWNITKVKLQCKRKKIETLTLSLINSPPHRAAIDLISQLFNNAFIANQKLFVLLACKNMSLSLQYGYADSTSMGCLVYAFTLIHSLNWYDEGLNLVNFYDKLKIRHGEGAFAGINRFILGTFINPYRADDTAVLNDLAIAYQLARDVGHLAYSNYSNIVLIITAFAFGRPLLEIKKYVSNATEFITKSKINDFGRIIKCCDYSIQCYEEKTVFDINKLAEIENDISANINKTEFGFFYSQCTALCYIFEAYTQAQLFAEKFQPYTDYNMGLINSVSVQFYHGLAIAAQYHKIPAKKRSLKRLYKIFKALQRWADWSPHNFLSYSLLIKAEIARLEQKNSLAISLYEKAIESAKLQDSLHSMAVANECAGRFYNDLDLPRFANLHFSEAYNCYQRWGASAKCKLLQKNYQRYFSPIISNTISSEENTTQIFPLETTASGINMLAVIKSSQEIFNEIQLDKLLKKFIQIIFGNTQAQRIVLLLQQDMSWTIEAEETQSTQLINLTQPTALAARVDLPLELILYVERTQAPLIIQNITSAEQPLHDPYIEKVKPTSILLLPILYQGQLRRILYLENTDNSAVFTTQHLQTLQVLATQAVISLENAHLYYQATHDPLTGLANRNLLHQTFNYIVDQMMREKKIIAILYLDIDDFRRVNDSLGNDIGDQLLINVASRLKTCVRENDLASRSVGTDEFVIMLANIDDISQISIILDRLFSNLTMPIVIEQHELHIAVNIGISLFPEDGMDIHSLLKQADIALYQAKANGRNQYQYYSPALNQAVQEMHAHEMELQQALDRKELCLYYQPIYNPHDGSIISLEALIRWQHPQKGLLSANEIIPLAEKTGLIFPIGEWVLLEACAQIKTWLEQGLAVVPVSVNISILQTKQVSISQVVMATLQQMALDARYLELELTESSFIDNTKSMLYELQTLHDHGIKLVIDDFGTGYSALGYLKRLPISTIKIDQSFIQEIQTNAEDRAITLAIIAMAHQLKLQVIAEGVETLEQLEFLRKHKVDAVQGYYLKYPLSAENCQRLLANTLTC